MNQGTLDGSHSRCVQLSVSSPSDAGSAFNRSNGVEICLVVVPGGAACCCQLYTAIPSGYFVLYQRWYKNEGKMEPGVKYCWPFWYRVSHVVNAATITYSAPSRQVPTADNVMIDINLSLTFAIGPNYEDAEAFVYTLGTTRFDEFLAAEVEEGIRGLVYSVTHDRVNDLREEFAQGMLSGLARKFAPFGVQVKNVKVTEVKLPHHVAQTLEQTTTFRTKISEIAKKHENTIRVIQDEASQELEAVVRHNVRRKQDLTAQCKRYEIEHKEILDEMLGQARVQEMEAKSKMDVLIASGKGDLEVAKAEGEKTAEEITRTMQVQCAERKIKVDQTAAVMALESQALLKAAENDSKALIATAEAENNSTAGLEVKRRYELEWERLEVMEGLAANGRRLVTGKMGSTVLQEMVPSSTSFTGSKGKSYF